MGKRKERRMAAVMAAGRRVKLDLFAEPSGDLGGSSAKDEVGMEVVAKSDTELPNSPSSSGQQAENPLSLLGQYSDDELDERSKDSASAPDGSLTDDDKQQSGRVNVHYGLCFTLKAKVLHGKQFEEEVGGSKNTPPEKADNQELETDSASPSAPIVEDGSASNAVATDEKPNLVTIQNGPVPQASDTETAGVVTSGWKMVLHEESKRYYYWNTVTGETSWEVPDALGQGTGLANELEVLETEMKESAAGDVNASITSIGVKVDDFLSRSSSEYTNCVSDVTGVYEHGTKVYQCVEQCVVDGSHVLPSTSVVGAAMYETSTLGNYSVSEQLAGGQSSSAGSHAIIGEQVTIDPSNVIRHAESLLERLKLLQRSDPDQQSLVSKYILETEIRLSDVRSLSSHGSSLAPFWLHSERHLNQLEDAINTEIDKHNNNIHGMHLSSAEGTDKLQYGGESKVYADESAEVFQKYGHYKVSDDGHSAHLRSGEEVAKESGALLMGKASPKFEFQSVEDVDMDVDMELEEGELVTSPDQVTLTNAPTAEQSPGAGSDFVVPPPPEEEWIPPPPPDSEGIPPPPPDEPPESCPPPPPSEPEPVQSIYNDQYNLTYAGSNMNYYVNSTDASGSSFYEHATGSQVASFDPSVYYAPASTVLPTAVPTADSAVYYGLQNGMMPIVPVDSSTLGSSGFQTASGNLNFGQLSSKPAEAPNNALSEAFSHLIQQVDPVGPTCSGISSTSLASTPATVSAKEYVSVPSYSAAATSITATTTSTATSDVPVALSKPPSKTSRMKKPKVAVASSLRSNKKVSSLVDKWKAAKEELQEEEEEERETALEILEKKRQREIEEWRAQQIASGEAKENANFQPLGGDWRERVKRRRAKKESAVETSSDATNDGSKQPDLNELSRDLPAGWQVYWDDSSKQVYYANAVTSETTWTRPTR